MPAEAAWNIDLDTSEGALQLSMGGSRLRIKGYDDSAVNQVNEYAGVYRRFAELCEAGESEVDDRPFALAADAFLVGERLEVDALENE